ncbi:hypothetical protein [Brevundimonas sp.]
MRDWGIILGGLIVWTLHFLIIYGLASVADVSDPATRSLWSIAGVGVTALGLAALLWIGYRASRRQGLVYLLGIGGCILSGVAIVFQSLPFLISG